MKYFIPVFVLLVMLYACSNSDKVKRASNNKINFLTDIAPFTLDSLVNVVVEIPAGTRQKWEVNKETGQIEWEQVTRDSFRVINYLPYPANYGFVSQTYVPEASGGDGDPVDVFVLGASINREKIIKARIVGIIHMLDDNEKDSKLLAVNTSEAGFDVNSKKMLIHKYPGVVEILKLWLKNYKGNSKVTILSIDDEKEAFRYLKAANDDYYNRTTK